MRTLYFDCFAGASGNMILGALLALGVDKEELQRQIWLLNIPDFDLVVSQVDRSGISATHVEVKVPPEHVHRHLRDIETIIDDSKLRDSVKERAKRIFGRLAEAEAKIHGIDVQKVHFHEVGAMDAIVDVVGACIGFELLGIERFVCSKIHVGSGFAEMAHGTFPVPPPAVAELLTGFQIYSNGVEGELITPTGAAIIAELCDSYAALPEIMVECASYGAGSRKYNDFPNVLRLILGESAAEKASSSNVLTDRLILLETNIDDISPQILGFVMERAFDLGALDCWFTSIQMKKNRPATVVSILCQPSDKDKLADLLYRETSTLGVRIREIERECLPREFVRVETKYGPVDVKVARRGIDILNAMPEFEQVKKLALEHKVSFVTVRDAVWAELNKEKTSAADGRPN
jgi:pyridinium-3,5-bisthiocarboxylic acid mononucleotide nickel chelatase